MTLGFRKNCSEKKKIVVLMSFVRLAVSLCAVLKGGLPFHSSAIAFGDAGIAFSGPSGAGKSTIAKLLVSPGQLLNDDFNIILPHRKNACKIYSTPFTQPETLKKCVNRGAKLRTIFFIEKSPTNKIENLSFKNKYILTLGQTFMFPLSDFFGKKILDNAERVCESVECKRLHFKNDEAIRPFIYHYAERSDMNYSIKGDISSKEIGGELFIYNRKNSTICSFNGTGVFIWDLLNKGMAFDEISRRLCEEYDVRRPRPQDVSTL